jgi:prolyl oligopeptidase PreP (S9A serine peptidase family)
MFTSGPLWCDEFGHVEKEDEFKSLLAYSPYHNVKEGASYPPTLIMTTDTDDRCARCTALNSPRLSNALRLQMRQLCYVSKVEPVTVVAYHSRSTSQARPTAGHF